jgi:hypothetical protein
VTSLFDHFILTEEMFNAIIPTHLSHDHDSGYITDTKDD